MDTAKKAIIEAAGRDGTLVFDVGPGGGSSDAPLEGTVDLAPAKVMRLGGANEAAGSVFVSVFYYTNLAGPPSTSDLDHDLKNNPNSQRLKNFRLYQDICQSFKTVKPRQVVFLTCKVGNSTEFVRKIANDWQVICVAYKRRVELIRFQVVGTLAPGQRRLRTQLCLEGLEPKTDAGSPSEPIMLAEEELPFFPNDTVLIGPPLP